MEQEETLFVVIEGIDGCGKDTQIDMVVEKLENFTTLRNISSYPLGKGIRGMIGSDDKLVNKFMHNHMGVAHMYIGELFFVQEQVKEALVNNNVICSRWHYSTMAYIGDSPDVIEFIGKSGNHLLKPHIVIRLRIDVETSLERIRSRNENLEFFETKERLEATHKRYDKLNGLYGNYGTYNIYNINVDNLSREEVHEKIKEVINNYRSFIYGDVQ